MYKTMDILRLKSFSNFFNKGISSLSVFVIHKTSSVTQKIRLP